MVTAGDGLYVLGEAQMLVETPMCVFVSRSYQKSQRNSVLVISRPIVELSKLQAYHSNP